MAMADTAVTQVKYLRKPENYGEVAFYLTVYALNSQCKIDSQEKNQKTQKPP